MPSPEILCPDLDRVEMQIADEHVAGFGAAGVGGGAAGVVEFVPAAMRQGEGAAVADAGEGA